MSAFASEQVHLALSLGSDSKVTIERAEPDRWAPGAQSNDMGGTLVRSVGLVRAKARIGLKNLAYNMRRLVQLERLGGRVTEKETPGDGLVAEITPWKTPKNSVLVTCSTWPSPALRRTSVVRSATGLLVHAIASQYPGPRWRRSGPRNLVRQVSVSEETLCRRRIPGAGIRPRAEKILPHLETEIVKRSDTAVGEVIPRRWVVERTFAWLGRCRRLRQGF